MTSGAPNVPKSLEHRQKISMALRGKAKTHEHKKALSGPKSADHRLKLKETASSLDTLNRRKQTMLRLYGVDHASKLKQNCPWTEEFWIGKGLSQEEAIAKVREIQKKNSSLRKNTTSHWSVDYWVKRGFSPADAKIKIKNLQTRNAEKSNMTVSMACTSFIDKLERLANKVIEREVILLDIFKVDGLLREEKIVVEYYGRFWHMHPDLFAPDEIHRVTGWPARSKWREDEGRRVLLEKNGYKVFVVWEGEEASAFDNWRVFI